MLTTIFILLAENRVNGSALWIDEIPNCQKFEYTGCFSAFFFFFTKKL